MNNAEFHDKFGQSNIIKTKVEVFSDGSVGLSEEPPGFTVEIQRTDVGKPVDTIHDPDKDLVKQIKQKGTDKFQFDKKTKTVKVKPVVDESA